MKEFKNFIFPKDKRFIFTKSYGFLVGRHNINTRIIFISEPFQEDDIIFYQAVFHPISIRYFRFLSKSWKGISNTKISDLKDILGNDGWAIKLPV
ncbi:MAG: hypothetical protein QM500_17035 [Methylococcales bacterium]